MSVDELQIWFLFGSLVLVAIAVAVGSYLGCYGSREEDDADQIAYLDKYADIKRLQKQAKALK